VLQIARTRFGDDRLELGAEPEVAIAKGLALAGRIGVRADGFRADMRHLLSSGQVDTLVESRVPALADALGEAVASGFIAKFARPAFDRWQRGEITTLVGVEREIAAAANEFVSDPSNGSILTAITDWQNALRPDLADLTKPICNRWNIPPSAMELEPVSLRSRDWDMNLNLGETIASQIGTLTGWVAGLVVGAMILALASIGAIPSGGLTLLFGVVIAGGAGGALGEVAKEKVREADMYPAVRRRFKAAKVFKNSAQQERDLAENIARRIMADSADTIVGQVSRRLETDLKELATAAELMVS
jgi:hypothetical protein